MSISKSQMHDQSHLNDFKIGQIYLFYLTDYKCLWPAKIVEVNLSRQKYSSSKKIKVQFYYLTDSLNKPRRQTIDLKKTKPGDIVSFEDVFIKQNLGQKVRLNQKDKAISKKLQIAMGKAKSEFEQTLKSSKAYLRLRRIANQNQNRLNKYIEPSPFSSSVSSRSERYHNRDQSRSQLQKQKKTSINRGSVQYHNFINRNQGKKSRVNNKKPFVNQEPQSIEKIIEEKHQQMNHSKSQSFNNKKEKTTSENKIQKAQLKRFMGKTLEDQSKNQIDSSIQNIEVPKKKRKGSQIAINIQTQKQINKLPLGTNSSRSKRKSKIIKQKQLESIVYSNQDASLKKQQKVQLDNLKEQKREKLQQKILHTSNYKNSKNALKTQISNDLVSSSNRNFRKNKNKSRTISQKTNIREQLENNAEFQQVLNLKHKKNYYKGKNYKNQQSQQSKVVINKKQEQEQNNEKPLSRILNEQLFQEQQKNLKLILQQKLLFESYFKNVAPCSNYPQKYLFYAQLIGQKEKIQIQTLSSGKMFSFARILDKICQKSQIKEIVSQYNFQKSLGNNSKHTLQIVEEKDESSKGKKVYNSIKYQLSGKNNKTQWDPLSEALSILFRKKEENKTPQNLLQMEAIEKLNKLNKISGLIDVFKIITAKKLNIDNFRDITEKKSNYVIFFIVDNHQVIKKQEKRQESIDSNQMDTQSYQNSIGKGENSYQNRYDYMIWNVKEFIIHSFYSLLTSLNLFFQIKAEQNNSGSNLAQRKKLLQVKKKINRKKQKRNQIDSSNKSKVQESISLNSFTTNQTAFSQTSLSILIEHLSIVSQLYINLVFQKTKPIPKVTISNSTQRENLINFRKKYNVGFPFYDFFISKQLKKLSDYGIECIKGEIGEKQRNKKKVIENSFQKMKQNLKFLIQVCGQSLYSSQGKNIKLQQGQQKSQSIQSRLQKIKQSQQNQENQEKQENQGTYNQFQSLKQIIKRNYCLEKDCQSRTQFKKSLKIPQSIKAYIKQEFQSISTNSEQGFQSFRKTNVNRDAQTYSKDNPPESKYQQLDSGIRNEQKNKVREKGSITYSNRDPRLKRKRLLNYSQPMYCESITEGISDINGPSTHNSSIYSNQQSNHYLQSNQQDMVKFQTYVAYTSINGSKGSFHQLDHFMQSHGHEGFEESASSPSLNETLTTVYENQLQINLSGKKSAKKSQEEMHEIRNLQSEIISELKELFISDQMEVQV